MRTRCHQVAPSGAQSPLHLGGLACGRRYPATSEGRNGGAEGRNDLATVVVGTGVFQAHSP